MNLIGWVKSKDYSVWSCKNCCATQYLCGQFVVFHFWLENLTLNMEGKNIIIRKFYMGHNEKKTNTKLK